MPDQSRVEPTFFAWIEHLAEHVVGSGVAVGEIGVVGDADAAEIGGDQNAGRRSRR